MKKAFVIAAKEYKSYFMGPVAYVISGLFVFLMSWMFFQILSAFSQHSFRAMIQGGRGALSMNDYVFAPHFANVNVVMLIMIPAFTMKLFAEEKKNRTMDLLMTSPVTAGQIVLGKFIAGLLMVWSILAFLGVYPLITSYFGAFDKGPILTSFLGLALLSGVYVAIGIFASSLTENVIIAYFLAFVISLFFWVIGWASASMEGPTAQAIFNHLSIVTHFGGFTKGIIDTSAVVYYVSMMFFFCFLSYRVVESARWR
jgi:ABC-2 type transport system permease protein